MDRKSIIVLVVAVGLLFILSPLVDHFFPAKPAPAAVLAALTNAQEAANLSTTPAPGPAPAPAVSAPVQPSAPEQILSVSNADLIWHFTSHGGGLKTVDLRRYPSVISRTSRPGAAFDAASLNRSAPVPVLSVLGNDIQGDGSFTLSQRDGIVRAEKTLTNGLRLVKEFQPVTNNFFKARLILENTSSQPLLVPQREVVIGTSTVIGPLDDPTAMGTFWYNGVKSQNIKDPWFANRTLGCIPGVPRPVYDEGASNVVWAAVHNQFFALAAIPSNAAPRIVIRKISVPPPDLTGPTNSMSALLTNGYQAAFIYSPVLLQPHQSIETPFTFYAGPKEYKTLAQAAQVMNNNLDLIMDFTGPFGFFSKLLLISMNGLNATGLPYGWTIIAITIILKVVFWPLTKASINSQKRMQALQPQIKAISEKYKDDPLKKHQKTTEFLKEQKVSQFGSCLPTLLQIPVFFGFYWMLRNAIELRGTHFLWATDLSQPDTVATLAGFPINPLPLIMGCTQLWQAALTPPAPGMDPGQQKIMKFMPLMFIALLYRMSAGLTLYWTVQNLLSILQMKLTKTAAAPAQAPAAVQAPMKKKK